MQQKEIYHGGESKHKIEKQWEEIMNMIKVDQNWINKSLKNYGNF
jgi:hypothetical protein